MNAPAAISPPQSTLIGLWLPRLLGGIGVIGVLWLLQRILGATINAYIFDIVMLAGINIILAVSLNLINGITGQFSLGHAGFMAIGAYAAAAVTKYAGPRLQMPPEAIYALSIAVAALLAALAGWLVGLPSLRLRGDYLAIVTLGFGQIIIALIVTIEELGGALGMNDVRTFPDGSLDEVFQNQITTSFLWLWGFVFLCVLSMRNLALSHWGRSTRAVRDDEIAAEAAGIDTTRVKVLAFVISAMWAGIAGGLYAHYNHTVDPTDYSFVRSVEIVVMVVLGGLGSITGATLAAVTLEIMKAALRSVVGVFIVGASLLFLSALLAWSNRRQSTLWWRGPAIGAGVLTALWLFGRRWIESPDTPGKAEDWLRFIIYALILIVLMLLRPQGLLGRNEISWDWLRGLFARRDGDKISKI